MQNKFEITWRIIMSRNSYVKFEFKMNVNNKKLFAKNNFFNNENF